MTRILTPFTAGHSALVASWAASSDQAAAWCGRPDHPFPGEVVAGWSEAGDVTAYLLTDDGVPVAYGEVWSDDDENEAELARVIVATSARGRGVGRDLVRALTGVAGYEQIFMRVRPDNAPALACYRGAGFSDVDADLQAEWNVPQPVAYVWLRYDGPAAHAMTGRANQ